MNFRAWPRGALNNVSLEDEADIEVNVTKTFLEGVAWHTMAAEHLISVGMIIANLLLIWITADISSKCFTLKLARTAEHAFYCTVAQVLCISESLMIREPSMHIAFGMVGILLGFFGVATQIRRQQNRLEGSRGHFRSKHSQFGLIGCLLLVISSVTGVLLLLKHPRMVYRYPLQITHRVCGLACFIVLMITLMFSYNTGFMHRNWDKHRIVVFKWCTIIAMIAAASYEFTFFTQDMVLLLPTGLLGAISVNDPR